MPTQEEIIKEQQQKIEFLEKQVKSWKDIADDWKNLYEKVKSMTSLNKG